MIPPRLVDSADLLSNLEMFADLDRVTLAKVAGHLEPVALEGGATLVRQGDRSDLIELIARVCSGEQSAFSLDQPDHAAILVSATTRCRPFGTNTWFA